ncbi:phage tail tape measure protein [Prescottella equi]|uniref:phage tail tape measure protein n=1 Tax=Rhodococcus hoagii TaxID=43767 RepID=UPI001C77E5B2|nr:phage tail tape measure protein [Prescottella equi]BCN57129.1 hypothetical protein RE9427_04990 [Prescottella equi]
MLNVGELVARLTLDDSGFTTSLRRDEQEVQNFTRTVRTETGRIDQAFRDGVRSADGLGTAARGAGQQVGRAGTDGARDLRRVSGAADDASRSVGRIGSEARNAADDLGQIGDAGQQAGQATGGNFIAGFADKIGSISSKTGPIAGSILGVAALGLFAGAGLASAIQDGLSQELNRDLFQAQTKTTEAQARKFALAAGEAFSDAFGTSVEGNLSTIKIALQNNILDPEATQQDAQRVVASLETISTVLEADVGESAKAVGALLTTGLAKSAEEAMDMIANAAGGSANKAGDLLEVITEYSSGWKNAGMSAEMALALIEQSTDQGADSADRAGDALREFGRRLSEEGDTMVTALNDIGLNGEEMFEAFKKGGPEANEAFDKAFDKIRSIEDPLKRNAAAAALLGDTSGDFYDALANWDPSEALRKFGEYEGAAKDLADILAGNAATSVQGAVNSISFAADGLKGILAEAFGPYVAEFADNISNNRAGVIDFFLNVADVAFTCADAVLGFVAGGTEGLAQFAEAGSQMSASVLRSVADMVRGMAGFLGPLDGLIPGLPDFGDIADDIDGFADTAEAGGRKAADGLRTTSDFIHNTLIPAVGTARGKVAEWGGDLRDSAAYNDEIAKVAKAIGDVGVALDGSKAKLEGWNGQVDQANKAQVDLDKSARGVVDGMREQTKLGIEAGVTVEELTKQVQTNRIALIEQLTGLGMNSKAAAEYADQLGLTPKIVETAISTPGMPAAKSELDVLKGKVNDVPGEKLILTSALTDEAMTRLRNLGIRVETLPNGEVAVTADTAEGETIIEAWRTRQRTATVDVRLNYIGTAPVNGALPVPQGGTGGGNGIWPTLTNADGSITQFADGGVVGQAPDQALISQQVPGGINQWAEAGPEAYIPLSDSKRRRSEAILREVARRFGLGVVKMANGGVVEGMSEIVRSRFPALSITDSYRPGANDNHGAGLAIDVSNGSGNTDEQLAFANWVADNYPNSRELIYDDPRFDRQIKNGSFVGKGFYANAGDHTHHVHWAMSEAPGAPTGGGMDRESLNRAIDEAVMAEMAATTPDDKAKAAERVQALQAQRDGISAITDSGVSLATDGQRVFVTNWPSGLGASLPARSGGSSSSSGVSYSGGGGTLSTAREAAGDGEEATLTPRPITDYLNPEDMFWQFAEGMGISKPGGVVGALMDAGKEPENVKALEQIAETLRVIAEDPPTQVVFQVKDIDEGIRQWNTYINGKSLSWTR